MLRSGELRQRLARTLKAAYGDGLLSEATLAHRLELLYDSRVVDPARVTGDLTLRSPRTALADALARTRDACRTWLSPADPRRERLLVLDWAGGQEELVVGREPDCDIVLTDPTVSRRHLRLRFRDGHWILCDLDSTNGTQVNDMPVVRCRLLPGDRVLIGDEQLLVD